MEGNEEALQLSFPLPPSKYYKQYTDENVKNGSCLKPPQPVKGSYTVFGNSFETEDDIIRPLEKQGFPKLYSTDTSSDRLEEMKRLNHSIVINYLELLDLIIEQPASTERVKKIEDINVLFINLHHLINEFRPHQARETLRVMLHRQKVQRLETAKQLNKHVEKAKSLLVALKPESSNDVLMTNQSQIGSSITSNKDGSNNDVEMKNDSTSTKPISNHYQAMCELIDQMK